jgi:hypothetical protein
MEPIHRLAAEQGAPEPPPRRRMPTERRSLTHKFYVAGHEGYLTAGLYDDGTVGELFITDFGKEGSTLRGVFSAWATALSRRAARTACRRDPACALDAAFAPAGRPTGSAVSNAVFGLNGRLLSWNGGLHAFACEICARAPRLLGFAAPA